MGRPVKTVLNDLFPTPAMIIARLGMILNEVIPEIRVFRTTCSTDFDIRAQESPLFWFETIIITL